MTDGRYLRHSAIDWFTQDALKAARIAVIGAGAVGNEVMKNLALLGVGIIDVFDPDTIEEHNLTRSVLFRDSDIGQTKASVAAQRVQELDPGVRANAYVGDFWKTLTFDLLNATTTIFCCVDNFEARIRCNTLAYLAKKDLVVVGLDSRYGSVELFPFGSGQQGGCYECALPPSVYQKISKRYSCGWLKKASFIEGKIPTTIITASAASSVAVSLGLRFGGATEAQSAKILIDTIAGTSSRNTVGINPECPCCQRLPETARLLASDRLIVDEKLALDAEIAIEASEPILVSYTVDGSETIVWESASKFDDTFPATISERPDDVILDIRDHFTLGEIVGRFSGRSMPCKFLVCRTEPPLIVEMRGGNA
ncbi:hypothetical protein FRZ61_18640 [Hypericibacter adhaerens]|jgi:molybdopterin/thiamine biosynthesis adenylyltransferase|uniref:THIF-type NAD/FAD binding fold domain-containing protein n=1 Tax=Hypericibacter adhaerens TaxID=2602016 RepID=A0A5J6MZ98_9PROT|nr:ThiF family adenylyltransferase [Hypericibacter adhaerens]QEX21935.1 hypothetical protein FRZ61_18640 [Hypericibacter adhaerens]